jgi:ribonuclease-3
VPANAGRVLRTVGFAELPAAHFCFPSDAGRTLGFAGLWAAPVRALGPQGVPLVSEWGGSRNAVFVIEDRIGHVFANRALLEHALTHRSAAKTQLASNERLEFLGDRVLGLTMAEWLVERFPDELEGALTRRLSQLVAWEMLARVADEIGLRAELRVPPSESRAGLLDKASVLADAVEAILGAVYLDAGLEAARGVVKRIFGAHLEAALTPPVSAKNRLQEYTLGRAKGLPVYEVISNVGPSHAPTFVVQVTAEGRSAEGLGRSKREAEQAAAEAWMRDV